MTIPTAALCTANPTPAPISPATQKNQDGNFEDESNYHDRPRLPDLDVDICFRGQITVSEVGLYPGLAEPDAP